MIHTCTQGSHHNMFHRKKLHYCVTKCDKVLSFDVSLHRTADESSHHRVHVFSATLISNSTFNIWNCLSENWKATLVHMKTAFFLN